jgi:hypothetical protein
MAYIGARTDTTQQSGESPDNTTDYKKINHITAEGGGYTETDPTCLLSVYNCLVCHNQKASFRADGLEICVSCEFWCNGQNLSEVAPLWDLTDNKYHNSSLKPKFWDEVREKFMLQVSTVIITLTN